MFQVVPIIIQKSIIIIMIGIWYRKLLLAVRVNSLSGSSAILLRSCYKEATFYLIIIIFLESTTHRSEEK